MPHINAITTAVPAYKLTQVEAKEFAVKVFGPHIPGIERLLELYDNTRIQTRYLTAPIEKLTGHYSAEELNQIYIQSATELAAKAARQLLEQQNISAESIDYIIYVNTTGIATPSIDARLINVLNLKKNIRRTPIWGLGCAGGAAGLSHAYHYLLGHPTHRVLFVAVELCSLTFIPDDYGKSNLVACSLFGDGAAAALLCGDEVESKGLEILDTQSTFYPDSLNVMGWNIVARGMQVVFDKKIPEIISAFAAGEFETFLEKHKLKKDDICKFLYHPGGAKVLQSYETAYSSLDSPSGQARLDDPFNFSKETLKNFGNMSSVTVLFVIESFLKKYGLEKGGHHLISALGPGFCSESLLVRA